MVLRRSVPRRRCSPPLRPGPPDADFRLFWLADAAGQAGAAVTLVALPLVALGVLGASALEAGLLVVLEYAAFLLIGLPAGAWVDRTRRRPVLLAGAVGRALLLGSVPVAHWLDALTLAHLYGVAFGVSVCTVFFDVAHQSYLPSLVPADRLVKANVRLESTRSLVQVAGPGVGGALIAVVSAPAAVGVDAVGFVVSALSLSRIGRAEPRPRATRGAGLRAEIAEGLRWVFGHRLLRPLTLAAAISNLCGTVGAAMLMVLLNRELGLSPLLCGLVFTAEALGGLAGGLLTGRLVARLGQGRAMCAAVATSGLLWLAAVPLFQADGRFAVAVALQGLGWTAFMTFKINAVAVRQRLCPERLLGRMNASVRFVVWGAMPVGALIGSVLGQALGARSALWAGAVGELLAVVPMLLSPLRGADDGELR